MPWEREAGRGSKLPWPKTGLSFLCEVKKASPSKGVIAKDFPYLDIARAYEAAGAEAISCLTEPKWFLGSDQIFREIRAGSGRPHVSARTLRWTPTSSTKPA